ncbi:MAG: phosphoribosylformylglycinamidine synthase subunit PurQ [Bacteroidales bacterium]|nr:phosphoribosylformylglycinamidine synthase subunit PurQ [Bacteroidales bacterium]
MVKSLILTGFGINCEIEMGAAYKNAGAEVTIIHFNELMNGSYNLHDFDILNFPGGFSFGDDIASGKVMSNKVKYKKMQNGNAFIEEINKFIKEGKYIMGVCNGFQILVQLGLLPNLKNDFEPETALVQNNSNKYEDRWVYCKVNPEVKTPFLKGIDLLPVPVRHGEGKLVIKDDATRKQILDNDLIALSYSDKDGTITDKYPKNPNGSEFNAAGLTDPTGQIFGLMPHPEAYLSFYNNPSWPKLKREGKEIERENTGQVIFDNIVKHIERK